MRSAIALFLVLPAGPAWTQPADVPLTFEVASIKLSPPPQGRVTKIGCEGGPGSKDPGTITCTQMNLVGLVCMAYGIGYYRLSAPRTPAPAPKFDIAAKVPAGATGEQVRLMWQHLLAERFQLAAHREKREMPAYELSVAKGGPKLPEPAEPAGDSAALVAPTPPDGRKIHADKDGFPEAPSGCGVTLFVGGTNRRRACGETMKQFVSMLETQLGRPVTDATGLKGRYDFTLWWSRSPDADASANGPTIFGAVQSQLGLKLEPSKGPVEILVVDHAERLPAPN